MLEWTGERYLPWIENSTIAYEHLHRYAYAAQFADRKRVLDLASGEGYGSDLLARTALSVVGIDSDAQAVDHAATRYTAPNLKFISGSIADIPIREDHSFDLIVCFEAIEHIEEHASLLNQVKRLLTPDGLFIVSTPNKTVYDAESPEDNPHHMKELSFEEFQELICSRFRHSKFFGQRVHPHSNIWPLGDGAHMAKEVVIARGDVEFEFISNEAREPLYVIALASDSSHEFPDTGSVLVDYSNGLLNEKDRTIKELLGSRASQEVGLQWRARQVEELQSAKAAMEEGLEWRAGQVNDRDTQIRSLTESLTWRESQAHEFEKSCARYEAQVRDFEKVAAWLGEQIRELEKLAAGRAEHIRELEKAAAGLQEQFSELEKVAAWREEQIRELRKSATWREGRIHELDKVVAEREEQVRELLKSAAWRDRQIRDLLKSATLQEEQISDLERAIAEQDERLCDTATALAQREEALEWRGQQVQGLELEKAALLSTLVQLRDEVEAIHETTGWKFVLRFRQFRDRWFPVSSWRERLVEGLMRAGRRRL